MAPLNECKANEVMEMFKAGKIRPRRSWGKKYLSMEVGRYWRWLSKDNGESWKLIPHKEYDKIIDRR